MPRLLIDLDIHNRPPATTSAWDVADDVLHPDLPKSCGQPFDAAHPGDFVLDYVCSDDETHGRIVSATWAAEDQARLRVSLARLVDALTTVGVSYSADDSAAFEEIEEALNEASTLLETT